MLGGLFGKSSDSFDRTKEMVTRELPIPDLEGTKKYIQFIAKKDKDGLWTITSNNNVKSVTGGIIEVSKAWSAVQTKYLGVASDSGYKMTFDSAFLILRDMEESLLKYRETEPGAEPKGHYMHAYRLLPQGLKTRLDETYFSYMRTKAPILPPATKPQNGRATPGGGYRPN